MGSETRHVARTDVAARPWPPWIGLVRLAAVEWVGWAVLFPSRLDYACHAVAGTGVAVFLAWLLGPVARPGLVAAGTALVAVIGEALALGSGFDPADVAATVLGGCVGAIFTAGADRRQVWRPVGGAALVLVAFLVRHWFSQGAP